MFSREVSTFEHRGWRFSSFRGPIATQAELAELSRALGLSASGAPPLPEETYPRNFIEIACDGLCLRVDAIEALRRWDSNQRREFPSPSVTAFDWTYGNDFGGALSTRREGLEVGIDADDQGGEEGPSAHVVAAPLRWTRYAEGLPLTRLTTREPILYYAEVILYAGARMQTGVRAGSATYGPPPPCCRRPPRQG